MFDSKMKKVAFFGEKKLKLHLQHEEKDDVQCHFFLYIMQWVYYIIGRSALE